MEVQFRKQFIVSMLTGSRIDRTDMRKAEINTHAMKYDGEDYEKLVKTYDTAFLVPYFLYISMNKLMKNKSLFSNSVHGKYLET